MKLRFVLLGCRLLLGILLPFTLLLESVRPASAALRCYVKADAAGLNNGSSWTNAYKSLQSALGASPCTEIWVAKGIYKPTGGTDRTISFRLKNGVSIYGGFAGNETLLSQRNPSLNATILSGEIGAVGSGDNTLHVVHGNSTNSSARLDGFTIRAGFADGSHGGGINYMGAGILNNPGSPMLVNLVITQNIAYNDAAGMYNFASSPILVNVFFGQNHAGDVGGGMYNLSSNPVLKNVTFHNNKSDSAGGALYNAQSNPSLTNVTFNNNTAPDAGGAIFNFNSDPFLMNATFRGNSAFAGGAMKNSDSNPTIKNSILFGDTGGEIVNEASNPSVSYSIVEGGYPGTGNLSGDPLLLPIGNYGGYTPSMPLKAGSPAIDSGSNSGCPPKDQRGVFRPSDGNGDGVSICDMGATESRVRAISFASSAAQDGWVLESSENSGLGGTLEGAQSTIAVGDDAANQQGISIVSFNTASLPGSAVILSARLDLRLQGVVGTNPFTTHGKILVDVRKGAFSSNSALQLTDFQAAASKNAVMIISDNPVNGWYAKSMFPGGLAYINKSGLTQLRLRFALDDDNDHFADYIKIFSGDTATIGWRPRLVVRFYVP